jgi:hypothetical protein
MILVEFGNRRLELQIPPSRLELLHRIGGAGEQHPPAVTHQGQAQSRRQVRFASARRTSVILPGVWDLRC